MHHTARVLLDPYPPQTLHGAVDPGRQHEADVLIDRRRRALREAVLLSEEKASDERRRMQRHGKRSWRKSGRLNAWRRRRASGGGGGSKSSMIVPLLAPVSTYIDLDSL
eukprot:scaffold437_cov122-Isochrysis_galbana.AAC.3